MRKLTDKTLLILGKKESQEMVDAFALNIEETFGREHIVRSDEQLSQKVQQLLKSK